MPASKPNSKTNNFARSYHTPLLVAFLRPSCRRRTGRMGRRSSVSIHLSATRSRRAWTVDRGRHSAHAHGGKDTRALGDAGRRLEPPTRRRSFEIAAGGRRQLGTAGPTLGFRRLARRSTPLETVARPLAHSATSLETARTGWPVRRLRAPDPYRRREWAYCPPGPPATG